jgi:hypothetical protein
MHSIDEAGATARETPINVSQFNKDWARMP